MRAVHCALVVLLALSAIAAEPVPIQIESKVMSESRTILVRTPDSYMRGTAKYPVLYLTDGARQIANLSAVADFLSREGRMPEMIIVGINNTDRTRDLTP